MTAWCHRARRLVTNLDGDDDLAAGVSAVDVLDRGRGFGEREGAADERGHVAVLDETPQHAQIRRVGQRQHATELLPGEGGEELGLERAGHGAADPPAAALT